MPQHTHETSFTQLAHDAARHAQVLALFHHVRHASPPAPGVINRVAACVGDTLQLPGADNSLLVATWAANANALRAAERHPGTNTPDYLVRALALIMAPLRAVLALQVAAPYGAIWDPVAESDWQAWHAAHPGEPTIVCVEGDESASTRDRRIRLERWALGKLFTQHIEATAGWPDVTATA